MEASSQDPRRSALPLLDKGDVTVHPYRVKQVATASSPRMLGLLPCLLAETEATNPGVINDLSAPLTLKVLDDPWVIAESIIELHQLNDGRESLARNALGIGGPPTRLMTLLVRKDSNLANGDAPFLENKPISNHPLLHRNLDPRFPDIFVAGTFSHRVPQDGLTFLWHCMRITVLLQWTWYCPWCFQEKSREHIALENLVGVVRSGGRDRCFIAWQQQRRQPPRPSKNSSVRHADGEVFPPP